ncbi:MAG: AIR synthase related protein, partial [Candidatus Ranarchaeia archaeon]
MKLGVGKLYSAELEKYCLRYLPLADPLKGRRPDFSFDPVNPDMIVATDPVIGVPLDTYGYFSVHYSAGDVACSGVSPQYITLGVYLPPNTSSSWLRDTCKQIGIEARRHGIRVLGGHTGVYHGLIQPIISTTCIGFRSKNDPVPVTPQINDKILLAGPYGYEFNWFLGHNLALVKEIYTDIGDFEEFKQDLKPLDVITPAKLAWRLGASFVHDITEGGLSAALLDIARLSGLNPIVDVSEIPWDE